jgi:hypothetical protein
MTRGIKTAKSMSKHVYYKRKHFFPFNFETTGGILILLHYTVLCEPKGLQNTNNAGRYLNSHVLFLQPKYNDLISNSMHRRSALFVCMCYFSVVFLSLSGVYLQQSSELGVNFASTVLTYTESHLPHSCTHVTIAIQTMTT